MRPHDTGGTPDPMVPYEPMVPSEPMVRIIRSSRRKRSAQARRVEDGSIEVRLPAALAPARERELVDSLVSRVRAKEAARVAASDEDLLARAHHLADTYLDGVRATQVTWSSRMERRWASCSVHSGRIRISNRLAAVPAWVLDGVLVHELAHLQEPGHGPAFRALEQRYPRHERVQGFLEGMQYGVGSPSPDEDPWGDDAS